MSKSLSIEVMEIDEFVGMVTREYIGLVVYSLMY